MRKPEPLTLLNLADLRQEAVTKSKDELIKDFVDLAAFHNTVIKELNWAYSMLHKVRA